MSEETKKDVEAICGKIALGKVTEQGIALGVELAKAIIADEKHKEAPDEAR